ncbi:hypothetical protein LTS17_000928 [Exophiala oligosperma]
MDTDKEDFSTAMSDLKDDGNKVEHADGIDGQPAPTPEELRAVRRKIDWRLMPIMVGTYGLQFYDKTALNQAALFGILQDLDLVKVTKIGATTVSNTERYSYVGMAFYCGYILGVYPITFLAQKYRPGKVCAAIVFFWGIVELLTIACKDFSGYFAQRFFLGFLESGVGPAFVIASSQWYTQAESALRIGIWFTASNGAASMIGPIINYGFGSIHGSLDGWQNIFLFAGLLTLFWSLVVLWLMPDDPKRAKFLTERERFVALERVRDNNSGLVDQHIKPSQIFEIVRDPAALMLITLMFCACVSNSIVGLFASIIIKNLGFNNLQSICLQIPAGFFGILCGVLPMLIVLKTNKWRTTVISVLTTVSIAGTAILYAVPRHLVGVVLLGYYLNNCYTGTPVQVLALAAANIAGHTKKSTLNSCVFIAFCASSIMSPLIMNAKDNYKSGFLGILICQAYNIVAAQVLRYIYHVRNKSRDEKYGPQAPGHAFTDETDLQNNNFRYAW